jgi:hypothetical protein
LPRQRTGRGVHEKVPDVGFEAYIVTRRFGETEAEEAVRAADGGGKGKVVINRTR